MFLKAYLDNFDKSKSAQQAAKIKSDMATNEEMAIYHKQFIECFDADPPKVPMTLRHPKLIKLEELILEHFEKFAKSKFKQSYTKIIIIDH